jgi:hypothetical protein
LEWRSPQLLSLRPACCAWSEIHAGLKRRSPYTPEKPMKFMVSWSIEQDKWMPVLKKWSSMTAKDRADVGQGVKMIGRAGQGARC